MDAAKEGSLYKSITLEGHTFHIYYGYYSDAERARWDPTPLYPDFIREPQRTDDGRPFARADQDVCDCYHPKSTVSGENWCNDCQHFHLGEELIGVCRCDRRRAIFRQDE